MSPILVGAVLAAALSLVAYLWRRRRPQPPEDAPPVDLVGPILLVALAVAWWDEGAKYAGLRYLLGSAALVWVIALVGGLLGRGRAFAIVGLLVGALVASRGGVTVHEFALPLTDTSLPLGSAGNLAAAAWLLIFGLIFWFSGSLLEISLGVGGLASLTLWLIGTLSPAQVAPAALLASAGLGLAAFVQIPFAPRLAWGGSRAGPVTIGFLLGAVAIMGTMKQSATIIALLPLLLIGVPLFAVTFTYMADLRRGWRALAVHERRKTLDRLLLTQGYTRRQVAGLLLAGTAYLCSLAVLLTLLVGKPLHLKIPLVLAALLVGVVVFYIVLRLLPRPQAFSRGAHLQAVRLLGVRLHAVTPQEALEEVERFLREDRPHMIVTPDASAVMRAQQDPEYREIMDEADLVTPDGAGVVLAAKLLDLPVSVRVSGCDLAEDLCRAAARAGRSVYLLGAEPGIAQEAAAVLQQRIPGLEVAGTHHGYFDEEEEQRIVGEIRERRPGVLLVALGVPRQEKWIKTHLEELDVPVCIGVGGSLDVISGRRRRAPVWMQRCGLEWLWRTLLEPRRLPRLAALPRILWMAFRELLRR